MFTEQVMQQYTVIGEMALNAEQLIIGFTRLLYPFLPDYFYPDSDLKYHCMPVSGGAVC